ncbi:flippase [Flavobacterium zhairuonense]|uniref:flippase n=1 Tax=Flavobacterium zhairuonense TaxID=2493631 RepID=UPI00104DE0E1|nr:flippase [Flavobacterium zhairuonense]KAF2509238.1 flippase [Flavobacterium zhairuonense]
MGIKKNFAYNAILTGANFIFPILVFPYVSRVLGVSNVGLFNFIDNIINYFILFSMLGISATGIREIAKNKNNIDELRNTFSSIFLLNAICTAIVLVVLVLAVVFVPKLHQNWDLMFLGGVKLIFNLFLVEWFFKGMENFKYITIRSVIVKFIFVLSVFIFVKNQSDVKIYYGLMVCTVALNAIFNFVYLRKFTSFSFKNISFSPFIKSFFTIGVYMILTSMYTSFNIAYLGFISGDIEVGYYTTATKLYGILLSVFSALTTVMLPRMSALVAEGDIDEVKRLTSKSYDALIAFCLPLIIISTVFAREIIMLIAGPGYEGAILPMRIIMPLMLIIGMEEIMVLQLLMPLKKDKVILINSIIGASVGLILNVFLVPTFKSLGSSIVWICSEISVLLVAQYFVKKFLNIQFPSKKVFKNIVYALPILVLNLYFQTFKISEIFMLIIACSVTFVYFACIQIFIIKNELLVVYCKKLKFLPKSHSI